MGTGLGGVEMLEINMTINATRAAPDRISPFFIPIGIPNVGAGQIAISYGMTGPNFTTVSACATGGHAIGEAWETIRRNDADIMIAGGTEAGVHETFVGGFASMRALRRGTTTPRGPPTVRPGSRRVSSSARAAACWCSRSWSTARRRGAMPLAEVIGYGARRTPPTSRCPRPAGSARSGRPDGRWRRRGSMPARSLT